MRPLIAVSEHSKYDRQRKVRADLSDKLSRASLKQWVEQLVNLTANLVFEFLNQARRECISENASDPVMFWRV